MYAGDSRIAQGGHQTSYAGNESGGFLEIADELIREDRAITCAMQLGDVLLMHNLLFHRSLANASERIRWSVDIRFLKAGDHPGAIHWANADDRWILRSATAPVTSLAEWLTMTE